MYKIIVGRFGDLLHYLEVVEKKSGDFFGYFRIQ